MLIQEPDLNAEPYLSAVKNSIYSIYFRGQTPKSRHDVEVVVGNKIKLDDWYSDILDSSLDLKLIEFNHVAIFQWLYIKVQSDLSENYQINNFLDYQYDRCDKKDYFLILTKNLFFENFSRWRHQGGVMEMKWEKFNLIMGWFENKERELPESNFSQAKGADFEKIKLTTKASINEITTYFETLKTDNKIDTSTENIKRVLMTIFAAADGTSLKKSTLDSYFNKSKMNNRSKK